LRLSSTLSPPSDHLPARCRPGTHFPTPINRPEGSNPRAFCVVADDALEARVYSVVGNVVRDQAPVDVYGHRVTVVGMDVHSHKVMGTAVGNVNVFALAVETRVGAYRKPDVPGRVDVVVGGLGGIAATVEGEVDGYFDGILCAGDGYHRIRLATLSYHPFPASASLEDTKSIKETTKAVIIALYLL
jgi:hypothetical protein